MNSSGPSLRYTAVTGLVWVAVTSALAAPLALAADVRDPIQREDLALINQQLARVDAIITRVAQRQAGEPPQRVVLDVARLRADVDRIRSGIHAYLAPPRLTPRALPPLSGDYRTQHAEGVK